MFTINLLISKGMVKCDNSVLTMFTQSVSNKYKALRKNEHVHNQISHGSDKK